MTDQTRDQTDGLRREAESLRPYAEVAPEDLGVTLPDAGQLIFRAEAAARRSSRRTQLVQVVAASVAVAAVVVGLAWRGGPDDAPVTATPDPAPSQTVVHYRTAAQVLRAAAVAAEQQPAAADSAYWYVESMQYLAGGTSPRKIWLGHDRPGVLDQDGGVARMPAATFDLGASSVSWDELLALPVTPRELTARFWGPGVPLNRDLAHERFALTAPLLGESPATPELRGALWRMLARVPRVELLGRRVDAEGRSGYAVRLETPGHRPTTYLVDPGNGQLLQATYGRLMQGLPGWKVTYLDAGPRSEAPAPDRR